ncbi:MAG: hypothetical protein E6K65_12410 [Nitrospirae bacterium]|nr:MAG: hypothetical protein E6K65_12410 [Nitrospirota bacterium]
MTFSFTGVVNKAQSGLFTRGDGNNFNVGQKVSGFYTFNSLTPDSNPTANGRYNNTITNLVVNLGPLSGPTSYTASLGVASPSNPNFIAIQNQPFGPTSSDAYVVRAPVIGTFGTAPNTFSALSFRIELRDPDGGTFATDALPTTPPSLSSFSTSRWRMVFQDIHTGQAKLIGSISRLAVSPVPLPAAVILFGAGLVALVGLGAGSWRQKKNSLA